MFFNFRVISKIIPKYRMNIFQYRMKIFNGIVMSICSNFRSIPDKHFAIGNSLFSCGKFPPKHQMTLFERKIINE